MSVVTSSSAKPGGAGDNGADTLDPTERIQAIVATAIELTCALVDPAPAPSLRRVLLTVRMQAGVRDSRRRCVQPPARAARAHQRARERPPSAKQSIAWGPYDREAQLDRYVDLVVLRISRAVVYALRSTFRLA